MLTYIAICVASILNYVVVPSAIELSIFSKLIYFLDWIVFAGSIAFVTLFFSRLPKTCLVITCLPTLVAAVGLALAIVESTAVYTTLGGSFSSIVGVFSDDNFIIDQAITLASMAFFTLFSLISYFKIM